MLYCPYCPFRYNEKENKENGHIILLFWRWNNFCYAGVEAESELESESIFSDRSRSRLKFADSRALVCIAWVKFGICVDTDRSLVGRYFFKCNSLTVWWRLIRTGDLSDLSAIMSIGESSGMHGITFTSAWHKNATKRHFSVLPLSIWTKCDFSHECLWLSLKLW